MYLYTECLQIWSALKWAWGMYACVFVLKKQCMKINFSWRDLREREKCKEISSMWPGQYLRNKKSSHWERCAACECLQGSFGWSRAVYVWFADIALRLASSVAAAAETSQSQPRLLERHGQRLGSCQGVERQRSCRKTRPDSTLGSKAVSRSL